MDLAVNQLFQWRDEGARIERILWIEPAGQHLVRIDVADEKAWPSFVACSSLERYLISGDIRLLDEDMYGCPRQPDSAFALAHLKQRDEAWEIIEDIVAPQAKEGRGAPGDGAIFQPSVLGPIVQAAVERTGRSKRWVRACLRHYWQRGQMKNALLPQSDSYGTRGKKRKSPNRHATKRGRPSMVARYTGVATGVNIDETIEEYFRRGTKLYYENGAKMPMKGAFERILTLFFHSGKELRNGKFIPLLPPSAELPTWNQYRYWYRKERDLGRSAAPHEGSQAQDVGERAAHEDPRRKIVGPGRQFEVHVIIGDIYLVSMFDRRSILGRPVMYIIVDVFSGLIVGMYVSLGGPNREGILLAIENMARDKVAYCREYDVHITEEDWPSHHLPDAITAGRSDLLLPNADILVNALGIKISGTRPCRLDWRESFERCFPLHDDPTIHWGQGSVNGLSEPGRKGHRLDSCLTLNEFRRLVIDCIIEHNLAHRLNGDYLDGDMIDDSVEPYPRDLWKWGIQNRSGALRILPIDTVRRNLLPEADALVTPEGIYFHRLLYTCDEAIREQWFEQARRGKKRSLSILIVYDPSVVDHIYVCLKGDPPLKACRLLEKDQIEFKGCAWSDIEDLITRYMLEKAAGGQIRQQWAKHRVTRDHISEEALHRVSEVRENRAAEKLQERKANAWDFQGREADGTGQSHLIFKGLVERIFASDAAFALESGCDGPETSSLN